MTAHPPSTSQGKTTDVKTSSTARGTAVSFDGFVHRSGTDIVDGNGKVLNLRGVGIGNWMLPEGYMWKFGDTTASPRKIETLISELIGDDEAEQFWQTFRTNFFAESDVERIAATGFDHIRLPLNSKILIDNDGRFIEDGFQYIDRVIDWCKTHRIWLLLDLHGAPGGQTGTNIDDSPNELPELFMSEAYRALTLRLWTEIARRYAGETVVLGYDLLNEPIPNEWTQRYNADLADLYRALTAAIRAVDSNHLIMYEGSHWATNWEIFTEVWDDNSALQFHKYWSAPDTASIKTYLDTRQALQIPIYMGEGGENNIEWLYAASRLYEANNIGWNLWTWKKIDTRTSPASVPPPDGWAKIVAAADQAATVNRDEAQAIFNQLLENLRIEACDWNQPVANAVLGSSPSVIPAWAFGYRGANESYRTRTAHPLAGMRADDKVTIRYANGIPVAAHNFEHIDGRGYDASETLVVHLEPGDWLEYETTGVPDATRVVATDAHGVPAPVSIARSARGLVLTAEERTTVAHLRIL